MSPERRRVLGERMLAEVLTEESAPESVMGGMRALTRVLVHEPSTWVTGGGPGSRYLVRVTASTDITRLMTADHGASAQPREAAPGTAIDPVCGMTVDLATATITHDGTTARPTPSAHPSAARCSRRS